MFETNEIQAIESLSERAQFAINRLAAISGNLLLKKAAQKLGRTDVQFIKADSPDVEIYLTMTYKPDSDGLYTVVRNGEFRVIRANQGEESDVLPVYFSFEIYGNVTTNMQGREIRKVSKTTIRRFVAYVQGDELVMKRYNTKESLWENAQLPAAINRADFTESDLSAIVAEKLGAFYNRMQNGNEPLKHRVETRNNALTLFGQYKAQ